MDADDRSRNDQRSLPLDGSRDGHGPAAAAEGRPSWLEEMESPGPRSAPARADRPEVRSAPDAPHAPLVPDAPRASRAADGPRASRAPDAPRASQAPPRAPDVPHASHPSRSDPVDRELEELRREAREAGRTDAELGIPSLDDTEPPGSEIELRERCRVWFDRWFHEQKRDTLDRANAAEERAAEKLGRISLGIDRFQRITNELIRLKARYSVRKDEVSRELATENRQRPRGIPTKVYAVAIAFLGLVEFFANAPVFAALLPRDPLTERQIRVLLEGSEGWLAGAERVLAGLVFRPDAALLAAGVITFLCVLAHFFGSSLREFIMQRETKQRRYTVQGRSALENAVPLVLTSVGLILVLGVLYQARIDLGDVGQERYEQDMAQVEEYRREAGWLRVDGELLAANDLTNRAEDMQAAAVEMREYSLSMSRLSFPILLLNLTLVLCAISAAYFHRRDARAEHFNEMPFEDERAHQIERAEDVASETSRLLAEVGRDIRELKTLTAMGPGEGWRSTVSRLESVLTVYRVENGRARGVDPKRIPAFSRPPRLDIEAPDTDTDLLTRTPADYEEERKGLARRFDEVRVRFNEEATATW